MKRLSSNSCFHFSSSSNDGVGSDYFDNYFSSEEEVISEEEEELMEKYKTEDELVFCYPEVEAIEEYFQFDSALVVERQLILVKSYLKELPLPSRPDTRFSMSSHLER